MGWSRCATRATRPALCSWAVALLSQRSYAAPGTGSSMTSSAMLLLNGMLILCQPDHALAIVSVRTAATSSAARLGQQSLADVAVDGRDADAEPAGQAGVGPVGRARCRDHLPYTPIRERVKVGTLCGRTAGC
jgi:hypothetical protein